jgi:hypothetical protein
MSKLLEIYFLTRITVIEMLLITIARARASQLRYRSLGETSTWRMRGGWQHEVGKGRMSLILCSDSVSSTENRKDIPHLQRIPHSPKNQEENYPCLHQFRLL